MKAQEHAVTSWKIEGIEHRLANLRLHLHGLLGLGPETRAARLQIEKAMARLVQEREQLMSGESAAK